MSTDKKVLIGVLAAVVVIAVLLLSSDVVEQEIAPELEAVRIAIEEEGAGIARTGPVRLDGDSSFRLHAVVKARTFTGRTIYYTEAERLEIDGEEIAASDLEVWSRSISPRILWFTVEGFKPYFELAEPDDLDSFRFQENFRPDWPRSWSIPGDLRPRSVRDLRSEASERLQPFGTQRYHVRFEIFGPESEIVPRVRLQTSRASDLPLASALFPTVSASLPGPLEPPSLVFGLTQIEPPPDPTPELFAKLEDLHRNQLAYTRVTLLRGILNSIGTEIGELEWSAVELGVDLRWGDEGAYPGDLIRVGTRWVSLLEDRGISGILDADDLCMDFFKGAKVARVGEVFTGGGLVEWAGIGSGEG